MNQILVSEKIYVTPEMKIKRKFFKRIFIISIFLMVIISSYGMYAAHARNRDANRSRYILANMAFGEDLLETRTVIVDEPIIVMLNDAEREAVQTIVEGEIQERVRPAVSIASDGVEYYAIGTISIPAININYPILSVTTDAILRIAPTRFWGGELNEPGNVTITAHNYRNSRFFSRVPTLEMGETIEITDLYGRTIIYEIYYRKTVPPSDVTVINNRSRRSKGNNTCNLYK